MDLTFLGATDTVTGSRFLVRAGEHRSEARPDGGLSRVLVDCGLFQGLKAHRQRNWARFPLRPSLLDAVVLTHAHIDHTGYLPALVRDGFVGRVFCTEATAALCKILLPDAGYLQEEEAKYRNKTHTTRHEPALPLYTAEDSRRALDHLEVIPYNTPFEPVPGLSVELSPVGHLFGAACVRVDDGSRSVLFSGDVGRTGDRLVRPPAPPPPADYLVVESTYGDRLHPACNPEEDLAEVARQTIARGGVLLIPAFAVGRVQLLLHLLVTLRAKGQIPDVPLWLDSPMAVEATELLSKHLDSHALSPDQCAALRDGVRIARTPEQSKALSASKGPLILLSSSGMATGGRVVHHLKAFLGDPKNTILLAGFQAAGTRGEALLAGADRLKIHGVYWPVLAEIRYLRGVSGHADRDELLAWLRHMPRPKKTWVVHGEPKAQDAMRREIEGQLSWPVAVPEFGATERLA